ncbi:MAG: M64 family metallopeptidase [Tahibacter sp.]
MQRCAHLTKCRRAAATMFTLGITLSNTISASAEPAHYVVFEIEAGGPAMPVFYQQVDLAVSDSTQRAIASVESSGEKRIVFHRWFAGADLGEDSIEWPQLIRGEFAHESGDLAAIDHIMIRDARRAFVLRLPMRSADAVEFKVGAAVTRFDLRAIAAIADQLPLAGVVPAMSVRRGALVGSPANRVDMLIMGDGYTAAQQTAFVNNAAALRDTFFALTPYKEYESFVNWTTGFVASTQSGADHPPYQAGCTQTTCCADASANGDPLAGLQVDTAFDARYCTSQTQRLLTVNTSKVLAAAAAYPNWDKIAILVNDTTYGGSGGTLSVTSVNAQARQIFLHEYGHSFSGLADEYSTAYPGFPACSDTAGSSPCEPNVTNQTSAALVKWSSWFTPGIAIPTPPGTSGVGLFEGARYQMSGVYRPVDNQCLMRFLGQPFCPVCREAYLRKLYKGGFGAPSSGIDLIEPGSESPPSATVVNYAAGSNRVFQATLLAPSIGRVNAQWYLDGNPIGGATAASYVFSQANPTPVSHTLQLRVVDPSSYISGVVASGLPVHQRTWTISVTDVIFRNGFD